ncbi:hypothetical protein F5H01DRAFT_372118 [Linnemannia elongata]|nr:hypothetical protein F5H01DRAFT_372118 [Linnemannia elongata]
MTRSETELSKQSLYNYVQEKYHDNKLDTYIANPSNTLFESNDTFSEFFKILRANEPDTSTEVDLDLSPIITYLRSFTSNEDMSAEELTQKFCWLLGIPSLSAYERTPWTDSHAQSRPSKTTFVA